MPHKQLISFLSELCFKKMKKLSVEKQIYLEEEVSSMNCILSLEIKINSSLRAGFQILAEDYLFLTAHLLPYYLILFISFCSLF